MFGERKKAVGVIGLGIIGSRVAANLREAKLHTYVWSRSPKPEPDFVASPAEMANLTERIQIFVTDGPALLEVLNAMLPSLTPDHIVLNHSTIHPSQTREAAQLVEKTGATFLDAPFTGSREAAATGELCYYIAGDPDALDRVRPLLDITGREILFTGRLGNASLLKIATNMISASTVQALSEAVALVRAAGLHGRRLEAALEMNACSSPLVGMKLPSILDHDYEPHFSLRNMLKDAEIAGELAGEHGLELPALASASSALKAADDEGKGDLDYSVVAETFPITDGSTEIDP